MRKNTVHQQLEKQNRFLYKNNYNNEDDLDLFASPTNFTTTTGQQQHQSDDLDHATLTLQDDDAILIELSREMTENGGIIQSDSCGIGDGDAQNDTPNTINTTNNALKPYSSLTIPLRTSTTYTVQRHSSMNDRTDHDHEQSDESSEIDLDFMTDDEDEDKNTLKSRNNAKHRSSSNRNQTGMRVIDRNKTANTRGDDKIGEEDSRSVKKITERIKSTIASESLRVHNQIDFKTNQLQMDLKSSIFTNNRSNMDHGRKKKNENGLLSRLSEDSKNGSNNDPINIKNALGAYSESNSDLFNRLKGKDGENNDGEKDNGDQDEGLNGMVNDNDHQQPSTIIITSPPPPPQNQPLQLPLLPQSILYNPNNDPLNDAVVTNNLTIIKTMIREARQAQKQNGQNGQNGQSGSNDQSDAFFIPTTSSTSNPNHPHQPTALTQQERQRITAMRRMEERRNGLLEWRAMINHLRGEFKLIEKFVFDHHINPHVINRDRLGGYDDHDDDDEVSSSLVKSKQLKSSSTSSASSTTGRGRGSSLSLGNWNRDRYNNNNDSDNDDIVVTTVTRKTRGEIQKEREERGRNKKLIQHQRDDEDGDNDDDNEKDDTDHNANQDWNKNDQNSKSTSNKKATKNNNVDDKEKAPSRRTKKQVVVTLSSDYDNDEVNQRVNRRNTTRNSTKSIIDTSPDHINIQDDGVLNGLSSGRRFDKTSQ